MRIISEKRFKDFLARHAAASSAMTHFVHVLRDAAWRNIQDAREQFPHADLVKVKSGKVVTVFNVGGGHYRVVMRIVYDYQVVYVLAIMTHGEYDKEQWKDQL